MQRSRRIRGSEAAVRWMAGGWAILLLPILVGCMDEEITAPDPAPTVHEVGWAEIFEIDLDLMDEYASGLWVRDEEPGDEDPIVGESSEVLVDYTLWLPDGTFIESSHDTEPIRFVPGEQTLIYGFREGVLGMGPGGKRLLLVPPHLAYGGDQWLVFRVELVEILTEF